MDCLYADFIAYRPCWLGFTLAISRHLEGEKTNLTSGVRHTVDRLRPTPTRASITSENARPVKSKKHAAKG